MKWSISHSMGTSTLHIACLMNGMCVTVSTMICRVRTAITLILIVVIICPGTSSEWMLMSISGCITRTIMAMTLTQISIARRFGMRLIDYRKIHNGVNISRKRNERAHTNSGMMRHMRMQELSVIGNCVDGRRSDEQLTSPHYSNFIAIQRTASAGHRYPEMFGEGMMVRAANASVRSCAR